MHARIAGMCRSFCTCIPPHININMPFGVSGFAGFGVLGCGVCGSLGRRNLFDFRFNSLPRGVLANGNGVELKPVRRPSSETAPALAWVQVAIGRCRWVQGLPATIVGRDFVA